MIYLDYECACEVLKRAEKAYWNAVNEKDKIFQRTQPKSPNTEDERVSGGGGGDPYSEYLAELQKRHIPERIEEALTQIQERTELVRKKEQELRESKTNVDQIYYMKYLDNERINVIAARLNYSESQIYRYLSKIGRRCEKMRENARENVL